LIFNKLLGGSFRIGVSDKTLINALTKFSGQESSALMHSLMGKWQPTKFLSGIDFGRKYQSRQFKTLSFLSGLSFGKRFGRTRKPDEWLIEYKWDGIRGQIIKRNDEVFIWSRGEELVTEQFPEIKEVVQNMKGNFVIDGEILAVKDDKVLNFNELQKRLNRKTLTKKMLSEIPIQVFAYDFWNWKEMICGKTNSARRAMLEELLLNENPENIKISQVIDLKTGRIKPNQRKFQRNQQRRFDAETEKFTLSFRQKKGDWWKWKINPLTIDAVLIYAQKGSGRRSAYYTDYTFAVKNEDKLVTIAKAYSGLTDKEIMEVSKFVNKNAIEKFGPVRTVKAELVFEIAFEGIGFSNRHKSGVALRFPRILRWRKDKTVDEIDDLEEIKKLIQ
jgi:DNA ligase-1